ncbi:MAG TPA: cell division protein ZapB [Vicinamibacteria bacterium]|nr:cell division protein ZapB [Vicinamibacteria bacterium]
MTAMEQNAFDVLEDRVRRAAETVKKLRTRNQELEEERTRLRATLQELEKRVAGLEKQGKQSAADSGRMQALDEEVQELRAERQEIRKRVTRLVEVLDGLE